MEKFMRMACSNVEEHKVIAVDVDYDGDNDLVSIGQGQTHLPGFKRYMTLVAKI